MRALALVAALASAASADSSIAYERDGKLVVAKLANDALTTQVELPAAGVLQYRWSDSTTLWIVRAQKGVYSIDKIVDGKPAPTRVLGPADWLRPGEKPPAKPAADVVVVIVTRAGEAWAHRCIAENEDPKARPRCPHRWLRLDAKADLADKAPSSSYDNAPSFTDGPGLDEHEKLAGPPGYTFTVRKNGMTCTGPKHTTKFDGGTRWVANPEWLGGEPVVRFFVERYFDATNADIVDDGTGEFFLDECNAYLADVQALPGSGLLSTDDGRTWKVRRGGKTIATFTATHLAVSP